tara:strand:+ start:195 stop:407 length:213 start_codon:yes stop_codon:yes gene_type:complete
MIHSGVMGVIIHHSIAHMVMAALMGGIDGTGTLIAIITPTSTITLVMFTLVIYIIMKDTEMTEMSPEAVG